MCLAVSIMATFSFMFMPPSLNQKINGPVNAYLIFTTDKLVHGSGFTIRSSWFVVHGSRFTVHGSQFTVQDSQFKIQTS